MTHGFFLTVICWLLAIACVLGVTVWAGNLCDYFEGQLKRERADNYALRQERAQLILEREEAIAEAQYWRELSREAETIRVLDAMSEPPPELRAKWKQERPK